MTSLQALIRSLKNIVHLLLAYIAVIFFGFPSKKIKVIGITGTDGKTTTSNFIYQLLKFSGKKAALISTTGVVIGNEKQSLGFHVTTPSPFTLQLYLSKAVKEKSEYAVIEVSSHAIDQHRIFGIDFKVGVLTNISREHLDYHITMNRYIDTKVKLLNKSEKTVLNKDDKFYERTASRIKKKDIYTYSAADKRSDFYLDKKINSFAKNFSEYNKKNLIASLLTLRLLGIDTDKLLEKIDRLKLPTGRLEVLKKRPYTVIVDFAHTPNAFEALLPEVRKSTSGRLIHIFGSAGERDAFKRPEMGKISAKYADIIILTAEDPRREKVKEINKSIRKGIESTNVNNLEVREAVDRRDAIKLGIELAKENDTVLVTGKGHEESMNFGDGEVPWSDIDITKKLLKS